MTDFEKIKNALVDGDFVEDEHFWYSEWKDSKNISLQTRGMEHDIYFEFDNKGNLISII